MKYKFPVSVGKTISLKPGDISWLFGNTIGGLLAAL
jgi:hypothetical protein